jgi:hypothetical protein
MTEKQWIKKALRALEIPDSIKLDLPEHKAVLHTTIVLGNRLDAIERRRKQP